MKLALTSLYLAEGDAFSVIIYLVIGVIYVFAQLVNKTKNKKKSKPLQPTPSRPRPTVIQTPQQEIEDFLESIMGEKEAEKPPPSKPVILFDKARSEQSPPPPLPPPIPQPVAEPTGTSFEEEIPYELEGGAYDKIEDIEDLKELDESIIDLSSNQSLRTQSMSVKMINYQMPHLKLPYAKLSAVKHPVGYPKLKSSKDFHHAVISRVLLGPPAALDPDFFKK